MYSVSKGMILAARNSYTHYKMSQEVDATKLIEEKKRKNDLKRKREELSEMRRRERSCDNSLTS